MYVNVLPFLRFQYKYLVVYLTVMLADWLQGTNMYTLYQSYDMDVGTLFLTGFSSAAIFGTFLGLFVDRFGRRNGCVVFCLLEVLNRRKCLFAWCISVEEADVGETSQQE